MKLRISETNVTLRLLPQEIDQLLENGALSQVTHLPGGSITIKVSIKPNPFDLSFALKNQVYTFALSAEQAEKWRQKDYVGFRNQINELQIILERDLPKRKSNRD